MLKIITLAIAYASALVVMLFCWNEFGYDRFVERPNDAFRVVLKHTKFDFEGNRYSDRIPKSIRESPIRGVMLSRCKVLERQEVRVGPRTFQDVILHAVDANFDSVYSFQVVQGTLADFRKSLSSVLLSQKQAVQFFGSENCIGKQIGLVTSRDRLPLVVVAVYADFPVNSHEPFEFLVRLDSVALNKLAMDPGDAGVYGRIRAGTSLLQAEKSINETPAAAVDSAVTKYLLQPLPDIYFGRRVIGESARHGDRYSILILICIVSLIAFLAFTNFVNLTTLTLPNRSTEIAVRKVAGATQASVLRGLAWESVVVVGISLVLAAMLLLAGSGWISSMLPMDMLTFFFTQLRVLVISIPVMILATILGPLLIARRFVTAQPSRLLSSDRITFPRFKRIISVLQLGVSLSLIVAGIVVQRQITRSLVKEPGRNKDQVVYLPYPPGMTDRDRRSQAAQWKSGNPNIEGLSAVSYLPNEISSKKLNSPFYSLITEHEFNDFFKYPMVSGRWFGPQDSVAYVVNELGATFLPGQMKMNILGVISNLSGIYNQSEKPVMLERGTYYNFNYLCVRIIEVDVRETVHYLERQFELKPGEVKFLDRKFEAWVVYEDHLGALCAMLAVISMTMACCAIYGLSLSLCNDKIKQVAIHKMFGASFANIVGLLMHTFSIPLLVATLSFGFVTYIGLSEWLRTFIYKTHLGFEEVLLSLLFCVLIIALTSFRQAQKLNGSSLTTWLRR